jgi:phosphatidylinositol glycan class N
MLGGALMFIVGALYLLFEHQILSESSNPSLNNKSRMILSIQLGLVLLSMIVTKSSIAHLQAREGIPLGVLTVGRATLGLSLFVPQLHSLYPNSHYIHRLVVIFLQFAPTFIILSISYEGLFYFAFCMCLFSWMRLEHKVYLHNTSNPSSAAVKIVTEDPAKPTKDAATQFISEVRNRNYRSLTLSDTRTSLFFIYLIQSAFFSASNIASVSSFSLDAVYRLIPVFDPFTQGGLLLLKLMAPFALLSTVFGLLNRQVGVAPSALFMGVMAVSDVMTLNFFWMVRDEGSWLDIGTTISHFVIASLLGVFVSCLEWYSAWGVEGVEFSGGVVESNGKVSGKTQ